MLNQRQQRQVDSTITSTAPKNASLPRLAHIAPMQPKPAMPPPPPAPAPLSRVDGGSGGRAYAVGAGNGRGPGRRGAPTKFLTTLHEMLTTGNSQIWWERETGTMDFTVVVGGIFRVMPARRRRLLPSYGHVDMLMGLRWSRCQWEK